VNLRIESLKSSFLESKYIGASREREQYPTMKKAGEEYMLPIKKERNVSHANRNRTFYESSVFKNLNY